MDDIALVEVADPIDDADRQAQHDVLVHTKNQQPLAYAFGQESDYKRLCS